MSAGPEVTELTRAISRLLRGNHHGDFVCQCLDDFKIPLENTGVYPTGIRYYGSLRNKMI